jgi:glycosyltransferase involved in cell wall biosynthesis
VTTVNQTVYARLRELGWDLELVVPDRWRHEYAPDGFAPQPLPELADRFRPLRVVLAGRPQRHLYLARPGTLLRRLRPDAVLLEEELFSVSALQWGRAAARAGIPFAVQAEENLDRPLPLPARLIRRWVLRHAAAAFSRSETAGALARRHGARGIVQLAPHGVPPWPPVESARNGVFTVGFAGRLLPEKGIRDLVAATRSLDGRVRLLVAGDGPLRAEVEATAGLQVDVVTGLDHAQMPALYAQMDVLVLPSRTTPRWAEQFGRVLAEALWCGVPVVGSDSGEIPWVIETTGGGRVFPEGDEQALARVLRELRDRPDERARLAATGQEAVGRLYSVDAAATALDRLVLAMLDQPRREAA